MFSVVASELTLMVGLPRGWIAEGGAVPAAVVVPIKPLGLAKSRLRPAFPRTSDDLVLAMALDVLAAAVECPAVARVVAITDDPRMSPAAEELGVTVWPDEPRSGLNDALL